jgi:two-component system phosphate regulon response regulator OmpR
VSAKPTVLLVEDSKMVRETIAQALGEEGYNVIPAANAKELAAKLPTAKPDIILLDLILPDGDGLTLINKIREHTDAPVLVVSGKAEMVDKVVGLEMGADDYIGKPIEIKELTARVKAHLRRYKANDAEAKAPAKKKDAKRIKFESWILDRPQFQIFDKKGNSGNLTVKEFQLLEALVMQPNCVLSREQLLDQARAGNYSTTDRAIDVQILRIRKKIGDSADDPEIIKSIRGIGYMLAAKTEILE